MNLPPIIALCGWPKSGKSTVQKILADLYDVVPLDDGLPLREIAVQYLGLTHDQVTTQAGKAETVEINGTPWIVRDVLGAGIGNALEATFGPDIVPWMTVNRYGLDNPAGPNRHQSVSFASVRRQQGWFWRKRGALVIEVRRPGTEMGAEFNAYDAAAAHYTLNNDQGVNHLERSVEALMRWYDSGTPIPPGKHLRVKSAYDTERGFYDQYFSVQKWREPYAAQERQEPEGDQPEHQD